ncbi:MAG: NUDIX domain-containing protein [Verrucomicrobiota bacterium]
MSWRVRGGLLMFRFRMGGLEVLLAHPGTPVGSVQTSDEWLIPKGGQKTGETLLQAAQREYEEELGIRPSGPFVDLGTVIQSNGKVVHVWAFQGDRNDPEPIRSGLVKAEWPPDSGQYHKFPEFDEARFYSLPEAQKRLRKSHRPLLDRLPMALGIFPKEPTV